ncbi:MAG: ribonuclease III domain-containing protein [Microcystaceae cyanobacterium]
MEDKIGLHFKNSSTLRLALNHPSYAQQINEPGNDNERLEYLGEAILNLVVVDYLYRHCPYLEVSKQSALRDKLVEEERLTKLWFGLGLGEDYPFLVLKEERHRLRLQRQNPFEEALKALVGAIYLDRGFSQVRNWLSKQLIAPLLERHQKNLKERSSPDKQLQFLGEALLKSIVADYLYRHLPYVNASRLTTLAKGLMSKERQLEYLMQLTQEDWTAIAQENEKVAKKSFNVLLAAIYLQSGPDKSKDNFKKTGNWFAQGFVDGDGVLRQAIALLMKDGIPQKWIIRRVMGYESKDYDKGREHFWELMEKTS